MKKKRHKKKRKKKPNKARSLIALSAIIDCHGGPMRHRLDRRAKEKEARLNKGEDEREL